MKEFLASWPLIYCLYTSIMLSFFSTVNKLYVSIKTAQNWHQKASRDVKYSCLFLIVTLGIFNSAYICYHNTVKVAQFFPSVSFTDKKEGKGKKKKGRQAVGKQTGCQNTYEAEIAPPKKPLPCHEGKWSQLTHPFKRRCEITFLYLPLTNPIGKHFGHDMYSSTAGPKHGLKKNILHKNPFCKLESKCIRFQNCCITLPKKVCFTICFKNT